MNGVERGRERLACVGNSEVNFICMMLANIEKSVQRGTNNNNNDDVDVVKMGGRVRQKEAD